MFMTQLWPCTEFTFPTCLDKMTVKAVGGNTCLSDNYGFPLTESCSLETEVKYFVTFKKEPSRLFAVVHWMHRVELLVTVWCLCAW